jgi:hypothetical protein
VCLHGLSAQGLLSSIRGYPRSIRSQWAGWYRNVVLRSPLSLYVYTRFVYIFTDVCKPEFPARAWRGLHSARVDIELTTRTLNPCILQYLSLSERVCSRVGIIHLHLQLLYFTVLEPLGVICNGVGIIHSHPQPSEWVCSRVGIIQSHPRALYFTVLELLGVGCSRVGIIHSHPQPFYFIVLEPLGVSLQ